MGHCTTGLGWGLRCWGVRLLRKSGGECSWVGSSSPDFTLTFSCFGVLWEGTLKRVVEPAVWQPAVSHEGCPSLLLRPSGSLRVVDPASALKRFGAEMGKWQSGVVKSMAFVI